MTSLVLSHGPTKWNLFNSNEASFVVLCEEGDGDEKRDVCVLDIAINSSLYDMNETEVTLAGTVVLFPDESPTLHTETDFTTVVPLDSFTADGIMVDGETKNHDGSQNLIVPRNGTTFTDKEDDTNSTSKTRVEWLLPLLAVIVVGAVCAMIFYQKNNS
jgi:hypothetical protein